MAVERMENTDGQCPGLDVHLDSKVTGEQMISRDRIFFSVPKFYLLYLFFSKLIKGEKELLSNLIQKCFFFFNSDK